MTIELHFLVAEYGGLHLPFRGITQYLRGLASVYERLIIAGVRILIVSSTIYGVDLFTLFYSLEGNTIGDCGASALVDALTVNQSLKTLK